MNYALMLDMAFTRLSRYKFKTLLMSLGILISVLATVVLQTAGRGLLDSIERFNAHAYPTDTVVLYSGDTQKIKFDDLEVITSTISDIETWDPVIEAGPREIRNNRQNTRISVSGHSEQAGVIGRRGVVEGEPLSAEDVRARAHVAMIGKTTAKTLFPDESPIGATIFIDNIAFQIKGVLEPLGVDPHGEDLDDTIIVPYTVVMEQMLHANYVSGARFSVRDPSHVETVGTRINEILRDRHGMLGGQTDDFNVITPFSMQKLVNRALRIYHIFLPLIAGTAFLISGLVILAIMQITIRERRAEIGLRKALGARPRDLLLQVLIEAMIVALVSALFGLLLAKVATEGLAPIMAAKFGVENLTPTPQIMLVGALAAIATALIGSLMPAMRAAKLDPVSVLK